MKIKPRVELRFQVCQKLNMKKNCLKISSDYYKF